MFYETLDTETPPNYLRSDAPKDLVPYFAYFMVPPPEKKTKSSLIGWLVQAWGETANSFCFCRSPNHGQAWTASLWHHNHTEVLTACLKTEFLLLRTKHFHIFTSCLFNFILRNKIWDLLRQGAVWKIQLWRETCFILPSKVNVQCIYRYTEAKSTCSNGCSSAIPAIDWTQHDPSDRARVAAPHTAAAGVPLMRQGERWEEAEKTDSAEGKCQWAGWRERDTCWMASCQ